MSPEHVDATRPRIRFRRMTIGVGACVGITPPYDFDHVLVANAGADTLRMYSEDPDEYTLDDNYLQLAAGFERLIAAPSNQRFKRFESSFPAMWLKWESPASSGVVVLIWA